MAERKNINKGAAAAATQIQTQEPQPTSKVKQKKVYTRASADQINNAQTVAFTPDSDAQTQNAEYYAADVEIEEREPETENIPRQVNRSAQPQEPNFIILSAENNQRRAYVPEYDDLPEDPRFYRNFQSAPKSARRLQNPSTRQALVPVRKTSAQAQRLKQPTRPAARQYNTSFVIGAVFACIVLGMILAVIIPPMLGELKDQIQYGYPRTYQIDKNVGHSGMSHFVALNEHGRIEVIETITTANGQPSQAPKLYVITTLVGDSADKFPVFLSFSDVNGKGRIDITVVCNGTSYVLYNTGTAFTLQHP